MSNKCLEKNKNGCKNVSGNGTPNNATGAHKTQSWRTVPPLPGTTTSKKVKDKAFNWCEKCRRWTTTHMTTTHTGQRRNNAASTPAAQANLSAFSVADPSVWMFDFDNPVRKIQPTTMETIFALLFSKATILLLYSVMLCLATPKCTNLVIQALRSIPWTLLLRTWGRRPTSPSAPRATNVAPRSCPLARTPGCPLLEARSSPTRNECKRERFVHSQATQTFRQALEDVTRQAPTRNATSQGCGSSPLWPS